MFPLEQTSISRTIDLALIIFNHKGHRFLLIVLAVSEWTATHKTERGSLRSSVDLTGYGKRPRRPGGLSNAARTDRLASVRQSTRERVVGKPSNDPNKTVLTPAR